MPNHSQPTTTITIPDLPYLTQCSVSIPSYLCTHPSIQPTIHPSIHPITDYQPSPVTHHPSPIRHLNPDLHPHPDATSQHHQQTFLAILLLLRLYYLFILAKPSSASGSSASDNPYGLFDAYDTPPRVVGFPVSVRCSSRLCTQYGEQRNKGAEISLLHVIWTE